MLQAFVITAYAIAAATAVGVWLASRRPRKDFRCVRRTFVAPSRLQWTILWFGAGLFFLALAASSELGVLGSFGVIVYGVAGLFFLWLGITTATTRRRLEIRRDGVVVRGALATHFVDWTQADIDGLVAAGVRGPGMPIGRSLQDTLSLRYLDVEPERVLSTIAYYREHPNARAAIGSPEGLRPEPTGDLL